MIRIFNLCMVVLLFAAMTMSCEKNEPIPADPTPTPVVPEPETPDHPLAGLPKDTGGSHIPYVFGTNESPYGYYLYTPSAYAQGSVKFPLMIFLHGAGEIGNSQTNPADLDKLLEIGPPMLIAKKTWAPKYPMVVASIQTHDGWWDHVKVKQFTEFMIAHYNIDTTRIYMTGVSIGANATWEQVGIFGKASHLAAAAPVSGTGPMEDGVFNFRAKNSAEVPVWAFHGEADELVTDDFDIRMKSAVNANNPVVPMKLTLFTNTGHDAWQKAYSRTGAEAVNTAYDPFSVSIYSWMLDQQKKGPL